MEDRRSYTDQLNRQIQIAYPAKRIVSLVPSQTELLHHLGLEEEVVGLTKFCVHPDRWFKEKQRIGGTKRVKPEVIEKLQPDLIIGNKEENTPEDIKKLEGNHPVWLSDVQTMESAYEMITQIGVLVGKEEKAYDLVQRIRQAFLTLKEDVKAIPKQRVLYLIWKNPYMVAGKATFIQTMLESAGFENALTGSDQRYPEVKAEQIKQMKPDVLLLSSEPFPFKGKHLKEMEMEFPNLSIKRVDGELFSWYGSRLMHAPAYFKELRLELEETT